MGLQDPCETHLLLGSGGRRMGGNLRIVCGDQIPHRYQFWPGCSTHKQGRHWVTNGTRLNYDSSGKAGMALTPRSLVAFLIFSLFYNCSNRGWHGIVVKTKCLTHRPTLPQAQRYPSVSLSKALTHFLLIWYCTVQHSTILYHTPRMRRKNNTAACFVFLGYAMHQSKYLIAITRSTEPLALLRLLDRWNWFKISDIKDCIIEVYFQSNFNFWQTII